jgi:hypothetical protein
MWRKMQLDPRIENLENASLGEVISLPVFEDDIGAGLVPTLSRGLYTNPFDCIREYVQNSVDSRARNVSVKATGNSVYIIDDGFGMSVSEIISARKLGVSEKDMRFKVGFRGIGIYSAAAFCKKIVISSKKKGDEKTYVFTLDCEEYFKAIPRPDNIDKIDKVSLSKALEKATSFTVEVSFLEEDQGTMVQLEEVSTFFMQAFQDENELKRYILRNLPIDFHEDFEYKSLINEKIRSLDPSYNPITLSLELDHSESVNIFRPIIPNLDTPNFKEIKDELGNTMAICWGCLHKPSDGKRGKIPKKFSDFFGFVYKYKGFTIGTNNDLKPIFTTGSGTLFEWYTGEVYVVDIKIIPDAPRSGFESNETYKYFYKKVEETLRSYQSEAEKYRGHERALERLNEIKNNLQSWKIEFGQQDLFRIAEINSLLRNQKASLTTIKLELSPEMVKDAEAVEEEINGFSRKIEIFRKKKNSETRKSASQNPEDENPRNDDSQNNTSSTESGQNTQDSSSKSTLEKPDSVSTIAARSKIPLSTGAKEFIEVVDRGLKLYLGEETDEYKALIKFLSTRYS